METLSVVMLVWLVSVSWTLGKMITKLQTDLTRTRRELGVLQYEVNRIGERVAPTSLNDRKGIYAEHEIIRRGAYE